jgi:hypothetical protein
MDAQGQNRDSRSRRRRSEDVDLLDSIASLLKVDINLEESRDFAAEVIKEGSHAVRSKVEPGYPLLLAWCAGLLLSRRGKPRMLQRCHLLCSRIRLFSCLVLVRVTAKNLWS